MNRIIPLFLFGCLCATFVSAEIIVEKDIAYLPGDRAEKLDMYRPAKTPAGVKRPGIVIIHGGGFTGGDKGAAREQNIGTNLAEHGYVCVSVNYLLAAEGKPSWPRNLYDCKLAVRFLRVNAEKYHVDPQHIGVIGGSAGGHLAAMVGLTGSEAGLDPPGPHADVSCRVQAVVPMYGPAELKRDTLMLPRTREQDPKLYELASPVTHISADDPPFLVLHGTADKTVPFKESEILAAALKKGGVSTELVLVEGAPHTFHLQPKQRDLRPLVIGFFDKHLK